MANHGHFLINELQWLEQKLTQLQRNDSMQLNGYICLELRTNLKTRSITKTFERLVNEPGLIIEIDDDNLFIKTNKLASVEDIKRIERILEGLQ